MISSVLSILHKPHFYFLVNLSNRHPINTVKNRDNFLNSRGKKAKEFESKSNLARQCGKVIVDWIKTWLPVFKYGTTMRQHFILCRGFKPCTINVHGSNKTQIIRRPESTKATVSSHHSQGCFLNVPKGTSSIFTAVSRKHLTSLPQQAPQSGCFPSTPRTAGGSDWRAICQFHFYICSRDHLIVKSYESETSWLEEFQYMLHQ